MTLLQLTQIRTRSVLLLGRHPASWAVAANGPLTQALFKVSLLAPEHVVKPNNFDFRSDYRPIGTYWSDTSVKTNLHASTSSDRLDAVINLQPSGDSCPMLNWVDDVFDKY
jgi:hypothetical protein